VLLYCLLPPFPGRLALCLVWGSFSLFALCYVLRSEAKSVWSLYMRMNAQLRRVYAQPLAFPEVNLAEEGVLDDPNVIKYSRELEALGCRHVIDVRLDPGPSGVFHNRIFALPAERIYVLLNVMTATASFRLFPAKAVYLLVTYLADGRVVTIAEGSGFRKRLKADVFARCCPGIHDSETLLAKHRRFLAELCEGGTHAGPLPQ